MSATDWRQRAEALEIEARAYNANAVHQQKLAEGAEARCVQLESDARHNALVALENHDRAEAAEADAALAWRRVTELQERGTQLVLENRELRRGVGLLQARIAQLVEVTP